MSCSQGSFRGPGVSYVTLTVTPFNIPAQLRGFYIRYITSQSNNVSSTKLHWCRLLAEPEMNGWCCFHNPYHIPIIFLYSGHVYFRVISLRNVWVSFSSVQPSWTYHGVTTFLFSPGGAILIFVIHKTSTVVSTAVERNELQCILQFECEDWGWGGEGYIRSLNWGISVLVVQTEPLSLQGVTAQRNCSSSQYLTHMSL